MTRLVNCSKLHKQAPGLANPPYPGALGQRIFEHICQEAWTQWLAHQTLLINEHRLSLVNAQDRQFLAQQMEAFLFGHGSAKPKGYIKPIN